MFKVKQLVAAPASLSLLAVQVYAAGPEKEASKKNLLRVDELSLYTSPVPKAKYVEDTRTQLEEGIGHVRHSLEPYTGWFQDFSGKAKPKVEKTAEYGREVYELLKNPPPGFYPRLGVIGFAGVIGLFLARGSKAKRVVYPVTGSQLYDWSLQAYINIESLWKDTPKKKKSAKASDKELLHEVVVSPMPASLKMCAVMTETISIQDKRNFFQQFHLHISTNIGTVPDHVRILVQTLVLLLHIGTTRVDDIISLISGLLKADDIMPSMDTDPFLAILLFHWQ
ncbi:hypothetical protein JD844_032506 [Phrynosoma platyrhinos]|uniref:MICOS complex subunit n=1 Tax=Phrynosoma platyrhinos TaxID=52577 RepID=A0ABQ7T4S2_PHRPL|nr:hypothetical protein JD844_032506 [Phrynosoma platyrhinos]